MTTAVYPYVRVLIRQQMGAIRLPFQDKRFDIYSELYPDLFAAGVDINGISDLSTMLQEVPAYWQGWPNWYEKYIGDPSDPDDLAEI